MPTVPDSFVPQIGQTDANTPAATAPAVEPMRNATPQQMEQMGQATERAGAVSMQIANHLQAKLDDANVKAAETKFIQQSMNILHGDNGYLQQQGADALNNYDAASQALVKAKQEALDALGNRTQQAMFDRVSGAHLATFAAQMASHRAQQRTAYTVNESTARMNNMRAMWQNADIGSDQQKTYLDTGLGEMRTALAARGFPADSEEAKKAERDYRTVFIEDNVNRLMQAGSYEAAKVYFADHATEIDQSSPKAQALQKLIKDGAQSNAVYKAVTAELATGNSLEQMMANLGDKYADNPSARSEAQQEVARLYNVHKETQRAQTEDLVGQLWQMRFPTTPGQKSIPMAQIKQSDAWRQLTQLDGKLPDALIAQWEAFSKRNENDPATQQAMAQQRFATYWAYASNPQALVQMSDAQIIALTPKMGLDGVRDLLGRKQQLSAPGKVLPSNVDTEQLKVFAVQAGIPVYGKMTDSYGPKDANGNQGTVGSTLGLLKYNVDKQIEVEQQSRGRELTRAEKDEIIKRNLVQFQLQGANRSWYNPARWFGDTTDDSYNRFTFQLSPADKLNIPDAIRQQIIQSAKNQGIANPSEADIQNAYFALVQQNSVPVSTTPQPQPIPKTNPTPKRVQ